MILRSSRRAAAALLLCSAFLASSSPPGTRVLCVSADRHVSVEFGAERCVAACALARDASLSGQRLLSPVPDGCDPCTDIPLGGDAARLSDAGHPRAHAAPVRLAASGPVAHAPALLARPAISLRDAGTRPRPDPPPLSSVQLRL